MKNWLVLFILVFLFQLPFTVSAQTIFTGWLANFNTFRLNDKFSIHLDVQLRSTDQWESIQTFLLRPGLNYHIKKNMIATAGYAYISNRRVIDGISGTTPEHRIWQQFIITHHINFSAVAHRFRLEQRFISKSFVENNELVNEGNVFANRFRYFIRSIIPLCGEKKFSKGFFAALQDEVFVNIGDKSVVNGQSFDQNRFYAAIGYRLKAAIDLETGYLNQYVSGRNGAFVNNHVWQAALYLRL